MSAEVEIYDHNSSIVSITGGSNEVIKVRLPKGEWQKKFDTVHKKIDKKWTTMKDVEWMFSVNGQKFESDDIDAFKNILSATAPPLSIKIIIKAQTSQAEMDEKDEVDEDCIYFVVHYNQNIMKHKASKEYEEWADEVYDDLRSAIKSYFKFESEEFEIYDENNEIEVEDIDGLRDEYEAHDDDDDDDDDVAKELNLNVKYNGASVDLKKEVKETKEKPEVKEAPYMPPKDEIKPAQSYNVQRDTKIISLGQRLKLLAEHISYKPHDDDYKFELDEVFKIAKVEGYDDGSYITTSLKDIRRKLANGETKATMTKINEILGDVMPFDYQLFFELDKATEDTATRLAGKVCWVLLGPTGAGKSTSIHFLCGSQFRLGNQGNVIVESVHHSLQDKDIQVGDRVTESMTRYIAEVPLDLNNFGIECGRGEPNKVLCVDSPGFEDTAGAEVNMANGIGTIRALKKAKKVKIIITFKEAHTDSKFAVIRNIATTMGKALNNLEYELDKPHGSSISGFLTKSNFGIGEAKKMFDQAYTEQEKKDANSNDNAIFKALIYKIGKKGPLNEIKIDLENSQNNDDRRKKILESLVNDTGYITAPSQAFNEFISESTLSKLKEQIERDFNTIQNILDNDEYFENPLYVQYIVDILTSIDKLKDIIKNAGGKFVENRLRDCLDIFKSKWNDKIRKAQHILSRLESKDTSIRSMKKKLEIFRKIQKMMTKNAEIIKTCKYYTELDDVNCLNEGVHSCFDELYRPISNYLNAMINELKSDDNVSDTDVEAPLSPSSNAMFDEKEERYDDATAYMDNAGDIDDDDEYDKHILLFIEKCCLLKLHKNDKYLKKKFKDFEKLINEIMKHLQQKCNAAMKKRNALNPSNVSILISVYSSLSKLQNIQMAKESNLNVRAIGNAGDLSIETSDYHDDNKESSSAATKIIQDSIKKLEEKAEKTFHAICSSYSLKPTTNPNSYAVDIEEFLLSKAIKTDDQLRKREDKLTSFCLWIQQLNDNISDHNMWGMDIFIDFQKWLNNAKVNAIDLLSNACIEELKTCNKLLIEKGAESWNDVEKLLNECQSLRKVEDIANNTSQEFFKTLSEFDFSKTNLANQAAVLIDELNDEEKQIDFDKILRIANQLYSAGCSNESNEMKQIYNKLNLHLKVLKSKTDAFSLSIESAHDLTKVQDTMKELNTIQRFADFMPDIQNAANECYIILNNQVMEILNELNTKYDLEKYSTQNARDLKKGLEKYSNTKDGINTKVMNEVIMQCSHRSLTQLTDENEERINELEARNQAIDDMVKEKGGAIIKEIEEYKQMKEKGEMILENMGIAKFKAFLAKNNFGNLKEIQAKLDILNEEASTICSTEREEAENNKIEIAKLKKMKPEIEKCIKTENELRSLNVRVDTIIDYRRNSTFLQNDIDELQELLKGNQAHIFTQKLSLHAAYHALQFLIKCKEIKWNLKQIEDKNNSVITNKYVSQINDNVSKYLKSYGDALEINLNNLLRELTIQDVSKCDLNNMEFRNSVSNAISKLNDCLREFRDISSFDHQMKMQREDEEQSKQLKHVKLVSLLFANYDIQLSVDTYINNIISNHKHDILINFNQWKTEKPETLPILRFICLSMSSLDRYISLKHDQDQTYYRIATTIGSELDKFGDDNTKQILPLFENEHWSRLAQILQNLQKTANVKKGGTAEKAYRDAVMTLYCALNKLMSETKNKLLIDINQDNDVDTQKILALNKGLKAVRSLVEIMLPHLNGDHEKNKVKKEEEALGSLLANRLHGLMRSALQSVQKRDFQKCEKRLHNLDKLMEYNTQSYVPVTNKSVQKTKSSEVDDNGGDGKDGKDDEDGKEKEKEYRNTVVDEYNKICGADGKIEKELNKIRDAVAEANKGLGNPTVFNPYFKLKLTRLHSQLARTSNEQFTKLWDDIYHEILSAIANILNQIKERNNQIQLQNEHNIKGSGTKMMTYAEQTQYLKKIRSSLSQFPTALKEAIEASLTETQKCVDGNADFIEDGLEKSVEANTWNQVANSLNSLQQNNPTLFHKSRQMMVTKIQNIYKEFSKNMKTMQGFEDNLNELDSYKSIGQSFTALKYNDDAKDNDNENFRISSVESTLKQIYKDIATKFYNQCKEVASSLTGYKPFKVLKVGFYVIIKVIEQKEKFPVNISNNLMDEARKLFKHIEGLVNRLRVNKNQGLDRNNYDIDVLLTVLDDLQQLTEGEVQATLMRLIPMIDKNGENKLAESIKNLDYDETVKQTKDMLNECKDKVCKEGLNKKKVQQNQAKRLVFLKQSAAKLKALIKSGSSDICTKHLQIKPDEFKKVYIKPCTKKMKNDIIGMQKETKDAFKKETLSSKELDRANANMEALYAMKDVFEKQIDDEALIEEIKVNETIEECQNTATQKVDELLKGIQKRNVDKDAMDDYMEQCAKNLVNLEYLSQHINFKTSINDPSDNNAPTESNNELTEHIQATIQKSMNHLTKNENTKNKMNTLYNHLIDVDANYGAVFTEQQPAFKASLAKAMSQKFRELDIVALVDILKKREKEIHTKHKNLIGIDFDQMGSVFAQIMEDYDKLVKQNLRKAKSFEKLKRDVIPGLAADVKVIADKAVQTKVGWLKRAEGWIDSGAKFFKAAFSWNQVKKPKENPRTCYWTNEMIQAISTIIPYVLAIWTLSTASCYYESSDDGVLMKARNAQVVAICCLLCLDIDCKNELINNLVEVGTGEGKSVIMAITAITLALLDFDVYCACYSELLSKRDENAFNELFMLLNVQNHIHYQTFNNIFEQVINDGGDIRETTKNIVLDKNAKDSGDSKSDDKDEQKRLLQKRQKVLFIDEVDKFFSTDFFGKQYTPSCIIPKEEMKKLLLFVWQQYLANNSKGMAITMQMVEQSEEGKALFTAFNPEWHDLLKESFKDIIDSIRTFKEDSYKLQKGREIAYKFSDTYSTRIFYGYRTIFAYLYELNQGNIADEDYVHSKLTWFLKCGSFSYAEIPNDFYAIMGVTGTLNSLSPKEHDVMQNTYGVRKYVIMPSLFDKSGKLDYAKNKDIDVLKRDYYNNQLHSTIESYQNNGDALIKRPIIVFFKNENKLNQFYDLDICEQWRINEAIQKLTPDLSEQEKQTRILNATKPNMITFGTEDYGRGIDFKVFDKRLDLKGMHVELTFWPETLAEEIQIKGRTARQGQKGSFHIILNEDEVMDQCDVSSEDIEKYKDNKVLYDKLSEIRNQVFAKQYDEAFNYVQQLRSIHKESEELAMSLRRKDIKIAKQKLLKFNKGANIQSAAKLSILIDCTGSMSRCLNQCKIVIQKTIPKLVAFLTGQGMNAESFEIQVVGYRNYNAPSDEILEFCPFTSKEGELTSFIHSLTPDYGWGHEAVEVAFKQLNRQTKKPNIVMLMADAPAHSKSEIQRKRKQYGDDYWNKERDGLFTGLDWKEELTKFKGENTETDIFCFYVANRAQQNFDEIAKIGGGKSKSSYLNVNDQKKSVALLQGALSETILLKMNNGSMEMVNKFRDQHKNIPTFL